MPRSRAKDFMQSHRFWLLDIVPSAAFPFYVLGTPFLGFQSISSPEFTFETEEIKEVNSVFKHTAYSGGSVSPIVLTRGVTGYDDSMWDWIYRAISGHDFPNRHLLLVHFTQIASKGNGDIPIEAWQGGARLPGKAWLLRDCVPIRYKGASDFDATDGSISMQELEIQPRSVTEFTLLTGVRGQLDGVDIEIEA